MSESRREFLLGRESQWRRHALPAVGDSLLRHRRGGCRVFARHCARGRRGRRAGRQHPRGGRQAILSLSRNAQGLLQGTRARNLDLLFCTSLVRNRWDLCSNPNFVHDNQGKSNLDARARSQNSQIKKKKSLF